MWIRIAAGVAGVLVVLLVVAQIVIPDRVSKRVEERLTEGGGEATVSVDAVPAALLLFGDGDRIEVHGTDLNLELEDNRDVLEKLDGFGEVDIELTSFDAGPLEVSSFTLRRFGDELYSLDSQATTTGIELLEFGADQVGGLAGAAAGFLSGQAPPAARRRVPVVLDMELRSAADGSIEIVSGTGTVAGIDTGPLAELITTAIVARL